MANCPPTQQSVSRQTRLILPGKHQRIMISIGRTNTLTALRDTSVGFFLGDPYDDAGYDILLPNKYVPNELAIGDSIDVFVYTDSEDRPIATTLKPYVQRDEFAPLTCVAVNSIGAFMEWGVEKHLLVPYREQSQPMEVGRSYVVYVYLDDHTGRLVGSSRINKFVVDEVHDLYEGEEVDLLAYERTDLGINVIVEGRFRGLLYANELFKPVRPGDQLTGYIKRIRDDGRMDISLQSAGFQHVEPSAQRILELLKASNGFLPLTDHSDPQTIYRMLEMSKKTFKKAIGTLYKARQIEIRPDGIALL